MRETRDNMDLKRDKDVLMGIDVGTSSVKTVVIDSQGKVISSGRGSYETALTGGGSRLQLRSIYKAIVDSVENVVCCNDVISEKIAAIGISNFGPSLVSFDHGGNPLHEPILYMDSRSCEEAQWINETIGAEELHSISGNRIIPGGTSVTSMLWIKNQYPDIYKRTVSFGHINTFVGHILTGSLAMDPSNASCTGVYKTRDASGWSKELCCEIGIDPNKMPDIIKSYEPVGALNNKTLIGLGIKAGIPVVIGGSDTACACLAAGIVDEEEICESVGSTAVLSFCQEQPMLNPMFINRCHVIEGRWLSHGTLSSAGISLDWFFEEFYQDKKFESEAGKYAFINEEIKNVEAGAKGVVYLPYLQGERSPIWDSNARAVFAGLSIRSGRREMLRAIMESIGYGMKQLLEMAERTVGKRYDQLVSVGGSAKNRMWTQMRADIIGRDIAVTVESDAAAIGAAILAGVGTKMITEERILLKEASLPKELIKSSNNHEKAYQCNYDIYQTLYPALRCK